MTEELIAKYALLGNSLELTENIKFAIDNNIIVDITQLDYEVKKNNILIPGLVNSHIHSADAGLRGVRFNSLEELVGKNGIKQNYLEKLSPSKTYNSIVETQQEAKNAGVMAWSDFREGNVTDTINYPFKDMYKVFGRPLFKEIQDLPKYANVGVRSARAYSSSELRQIVAYTHNQNNLVFMHASESSNLRNEWIDKYGITDIEWAIEHKVDSLVHITHADDNDLELIERTNTGVILCYRSNKFTKTGFPDINKILEYDLNIGIGTDNAMMHSPSLWEEMRVLYQLGIEARRILSFGTVEGAKLLKLNWGIKIGMSNILELELPKLKAGQNIYELIVNSEHRLNNQWRM